MSKLLTILFLGAATIAAPAIAGQRQTPEMKLQKVLDGRVAGKPVDCISLSSVGSSQIIEGKAIVYHAGGRLYVNEPRSGYHAGGRLYVNEPRSGADQLDDDVILVTRTSGSQLCSIDTVNLIDSASRFPRGFVQLGKFVPYTRVKRAN